MMISGAWAASKEAAAVGWIYVGLICSLTKLH